MKKIILMFFILCAGSLAAQEFNLGAEIRPRFELRNGYSSLMPDHTDPAAFISQRTRLNLDFQNDKLKFFTAIQNVNVWGDVGTTSPTSKNGLAFHQAWAELFITTKFSLKLGRQEISYDDERIFGALGWVQQARSHDALVLKYTASENHQVHIGLALNAQNESYTNQAYSINQYQNLQYARYQGQFDNLRLTLLAMNLGMPYQRDSLQHYAYNQTFGARLVYTTNKFAVNGSAYVQTGNLAAVNLLAWYASANVKYGISDNFTAGAGFEYLSGTDQNTSKNEINSFTPWFGTNHKFNGAMDYFYVGNHINSVGLTDIYVFGEITHKDFSASLRPHIFLSSATILSPADNTKTMDPNLGTEIDLTLGYRFNEYVGLQLGYSQMFATESMEALRSGNADNLNNWGWLMVTVNPTLFSSSKSKSN